MNVFHITILSFNFLGSTSALIVYFKTEIGKYITKTCPCNRQRFFGTLKIENFQMKNFDISLIFAQNIDRGYTLEPPHRGGSNEYPQSMFWSKNK